MRIRCNIITGTVKDLAKQIGRSDSYTNNLISVWQTQNNSAEYPTASQLNDLLNYNKEQSWDIYLAIPNYEVLEYNPSEVPIKHSDGQVYLMRLPKENPMEHFYNMYKHLSELRKLVVTPEEAYRFILWREMAFMQHDLSKKAENRAIAEGEAIKKAQEWRRRNPIEVTSVHESNSQSSQETVTAQQQTTTEKNAENVYKIPKVGTDALRINYDTPIARLVRDFTATERHNRVEMLARNFSIIVNQAVQEKIQENTDAINEELSKDEPNQANLTRLYEKTRLFNDSVEGRKAIIKEKTLKQIFQQMKEEIESYTQMTAEELDEDYGKGRGEYVLSEYQKVLNNWDLLLEEACIIIEKREHLRIITDKHSYNTGNKSEDVVSGTIVDTAQQDEKNNSDFGDDEDGKRVDGNSGWTYKVRFADPLITLSKGVKEVLSNIEREGINGEPEVDDLGYTKYIDSEYAHIVLLNESSDMIDSDDFSVENSDGTLSFPTLERAAEKYPWINRVITSLQTDPSLISQFYADLRKDFIPYWMQYYDGQDGKWKTKALNQASAFESTMSQIISNYEGGITLDEDNIYDSGRVISPIKAKLGIDLTSDILSLLRNFDEEDYPAITEKVSKGLRMLGLNTNSYVIDNLLKSENSIVRLDKVVRAMKSIFEGVDKMPEDAHLVDYFSGYYNTIAQEVGLVSELENVTSFRNGDKTYYSYSAPNYLNTMVKNFKSDKRRDSYLEEQFGRDSWFRDQNTGQWNSEWLRLIESDEDVRDQMMLKELNTIKSPTHKSQEDSEYERWTPYLIKNAFIREYFSVGYNKSSKKQFAWYNMPIFADSPVTMFIKFLRYTSDSEGSFKDKLLPLLNQVVKQELRRIERVQNRRAIGASPISNFDDNGDKFHFFVELNTYNNGTFLSEAMRLTSEKDIDGLNKLINEAITDIMNQNFNSFLNTNFSQASYEDLMESLLADGTITSKSKFEDALEEYFWNQAYATTQIIELTTTDLAYYKDGIDFQKRYKEVYSSGTKLNTNSKYGRKTERTIYLEDQIVTSSSYQDIKEVLDRAVQSGHIKSYDRDAILYKFKNINVADAQAYRSLSSMRAVLDMLGAWTPEMQESMNRFENNDWNMADFNTVWQTIKPFVFSNIQKPDGLGGTLRVPHQNKNSEFLLLSLYNVVAGLSGKSSKLKAINKFMEDNNIDVIQFESAVKAGKQGIININYSDPKLQVWKINNANEAKAVEEAAEKSLGKKYAGATDFERFKAGNDYLLDNGKIGQEEYNDRFRAIEPDEKEVYSILSSMSMDKGEFKPDVVHEISYEDYVVQQPNPEHLFDHSAVFGSQFRNLIISDMPDDPDFRVKVNGRELTKQQVLNLYQSLIVENLLEDWGKVNEKFDSIDTLQKALLQEVKGNPKYGRDMRDALQIVEIINPITGEKEKVFNIPLDNPSTTLKIQELVTSMFKNAVTKQEIKGAACTLVSGFGLTEELNIIYSNDGSIQGIECYLPAYSKEFYQPFSVTKVIDGKECQELDISKLPMELRRIIGYRIPTEDKYSMAPLIIKGFLPQQNGSCIMLPSDITAIAGSDYDIDKMFLMIPEFKKKNIYSIKDAWNTFYQENPQITSQIEANQWAAFEDAYQRLLQTNPEEAEEIDVEDERFKDWFVKESGLKKYEWVEGVQEAFSKWFRTNKERFYQRTEVTKVKYDMNRAPQEHNRDSRNNMLIDIAWGILTHSDTAEKINNPGNFDKAKVAARVAVITSDPQLIYEFAEENNLSVNGVPDLDLVCDTLLRMSKEGKLDELDKFLKNHKIVRSQLTVDTFIYNHRQNMTGGALIGMYANNTTMQAKFQVTGLSVKDDYVFTINGRTVQSLHDIMSPNGERISKNCANFSAASVDNVKDPILADLMQNTQTANVAGFMLRAGMSIEEIGLLFSQPIVRSCISEIGGLSELNTYIRGMRASLKENGGGVDDNIQLHNFTSKELMMNALNRARTEWTDEQYNDYLASQIQAGLLMKHIVAIAEDLSGLTQIARADSPNGAINVSIAGAKNQVQKVNLYTRRARSKKFTLTGIDDIMKNDYITTDMSTDQMREKLLKSKMPMLQSFYSLGIELGSQVLGQYFSQTTPYSDALVEQLYNNSSQGIVSNKVLDSFYSELVEFALSNTKMLGNDGDTTYDEKRDYYLYDFPKKYLEVIADNPDIAKIGIIQKMKVRNGDIIMDKSGRLTQSMREALMRDFDMLIYSSNPVAQELAIDLFKYSYYKDGFKFGPNNFGLFFSSNFISQLPEFVGALRELRFNMQSGTYFDNYLPQFYANHWNEGIVPLISDYGDTVIESPDGKIAIDAKAVLNRNEPIAKSYPFIVYRKVTGLNPDGSSITEDSLYALSLDAKDRAIYEPAITFTSSQKNKRGVKYNSNMTVKEMEGIEPDEYRVKTNASLNPSTNALNEDRLSSLEDYFSGIGGMDSALSDLEQDYSEALGQAQLDQPIC